MSNVVFSKGQNYTILMMSYTCCISLWLLNKLLAKRRKYAPEIQVERISGDEYTQRDLGEYLWLYDNWAALVVVCHTFTNVLLYNDLYNED